MFAAQASHHPVVVAVVVVILVVAAIPMLYVMFRGMRVAIDQERASLKKLAPKQRRLVAVFIASELIFLGAGFVVGYLTSNTSDPFITGALGAFAGGCAWVVLCWIVAGFIRKNRRTAQ